MDTAKIYAKLRLSFLVVSLKPPEIIAFAKCDNLIQSGFSRALIGHVAGFFEIVQKGIYGGICCAPVYEIMFINRGALKFRC